MRVPIPNDWDGESWIETCISWPDSAQWMGLLFGALSRPTRGWYWDEKTGSVVAAQAVGWQIYEKSIPLQPCGGCDKMQFKVEDCGLFYSIDEGETWLVVPGGENICGTDGADGADGADGVSAGGCILGAVLSYATATAPAGTLPCDGSTYAAIDYPEFFAVLHDAYKIDADNFKLPDLRGRVIVGVGQGVGLASRQMGNTGGEEWHELSELELPPHDHTFYMASGGGNDRAAPNVTGIGSPFLAATSNAIGDTGAGIPFNVMQPFEALRYCVVVDPTLCGGEPAECDCPVEVDGDGKLWIDLDGDGTVDEPYSPDDRYDRPFITRPTPDPGQDPCCVLAQAVMLAAQEYVEEAANKRDQETTALGLAGALLALIALFVNPLVAATFLLATAVTLLGLSSNFIRQAFNTTTWAAFRALVFCNCPGPDGYTEDAVSTLIEAIETTWSDDEPVRQMLSTFIEGMGAAGMEATVSVYNVTSADCTDIECPEPCAWIMNASESNVLTEQIGGWVLIESGNVEMAGGGYGVWFAKSDGGCFQIDGALDLIYTNDITISGVDCEDTSFNDLTLEALTNRCWQILKFESSLECSVRLKPLCECTIDPPDLTFYDNVIASDGGNVADAGSWLTADAKEINMAWETIGTSGSYTYFPSVTYHWKMDVPAGINEFVLVTPSFDEGRPNESWHTQCIGAEWDTVPLVDIGALDHWDIVSVEDFMTEVHITYRYREGTWPGGTLLFKDAQFGCKSNNQPVPAMEFNNTYRVFLPEEL